MTPEQKRAWVDARAGDRAANLATIKTMTPEQKRARTRATRAGNAAMWAAMTPEERSARAKIASDAAVRAMRASGVSPIAKLNDAAVREIRRLAAAGVHHHVIAEQFRVSKALVSAIKNRRIWKHVEDLVPAVQALRDQLAAAHAGR